MEMTELSRLQAVVKKLRAEDGCPWDKVQTHESLKPEVIEEAAEVIGGINILKETGDSRNLQEELGDLLLQVVMQSQIAEEEGLFTLEDVAKAASDKMVRRHPHVFPATDNTGASTAMSWEEIKAQEHEGREWEKDDLPDAFRESKELLDRVMQRKGISISDSVTIKKGRNGNE